MPIVVAGGPKLASDRAALELAHGAIADGARGIDMGRNIWQSDHPVAMLKGLRAIVHEKATVKEALEIVEAEKRTPSPAPKRLATA